jgi:hypothetical protein
MQWNAALIAGMDGLVHLAVTNWWTTKGVFATKLRDARSRGIAHLYQEMGAIAGSCL